MMTTLEIHGHEMYMNIDAHPAHTDLSNMLMLIFGGYYSTLYQNERRNLAT